MRIALTAAALLMLCGTAMAQSIDKFREDFVRNFGESCLKTQRAAPENASQPDAVIVKYCGCVTRHAPEIITVDDLMEISRTGKRSREMQMKLNSMGEACLAWMNGEVTDETADEPRVKR